MYMDLLRESLSLKIFPPWWYFARDNSIYFSPSSKICHRSMRKSALLGTWPYDRDKMQIREHEFFYVSDKFKGQGCSSLPARCTRGHPLRSKITLSKVLFLILAAGEIRQNFSRINLKEEASSRVTISIISF